MKKILIILILSIILIGCTNNNAIKSSVAHLENGNDSYFEYKNQAYTKEDIFQVLKSQYISNDFTSMIAEKALLTENFDNSIQNEYLSNQYDAYSSAYGESYISSVYGTKEDYINNKEIISQFSQIIYPINYYIKNIDEYQKKYGTVKAYIVSSEDEKTMKKFYKSLKNKTKFEKAYSKYIDKENEIVEMVITQEDEYPEEVLKALKNTEVGKYSDLIITTTQTENNNDTSTEKTENNVYYCIKILSKDPNEYLIDFASCVNEKENVDVLELIKRDHTINIYDQDLYEAYNKSLLKEESNK